MELPDRVEFLYLDMEPLAPSLTLCICVGHMDGWVVQSLRNGVMRPTRPYPQGNKAICTACRLLRIVPAYYVSVALVAWLTLGQHKNESLPMHFRVVVAEMFHTHQ